MNSQNEKNDTIEINLLEILYVLRAKWYFILIGMIGIGALAAVYSFTLAKPVYESTSRLYILTKTTSITSLADIQMGSSLTQDYKELITSRTVVEQVIENLGLEKTYAGLVSQITVENPSNTRVIKLTIKDHDPEEAKRIVDELTDVSREGISNIMDTAAPNVVEYGTVPVKPISPNKKKNTAIGMLIGAVLASAIVIVQFLLDDTVKNAEDVEKYLGINTLASIPLRDDEKKAKENAKKKKRRKGADK